jgi:hypothetical protein
MAALFKKTRQLRPRSEEKLYRSKTIKIGRKIDQLSRRWGLREARPKKRASKKTMFLTVTTPLTTGVSTRKKIMSKARGRDLVEIGAIAAVIFS